jgi:predicted solute-binding protein
VVNRFVYRQEFATEPLARALAQRGWLVTASEHPADALIDGSADVVLTPALDYARSVGVVDYALVPDVAIVTSGFAGLLKLIFKPGLGGFDSIAARDVDSPDAMVARLILSEKHDIEPRMIAVRDRALDDMLELADAAFLAGDDAVFDRSGSRTLLDLSDEWEDMTEAPLPYMLAWGRVGDVSEEMLHDISAARDTAVLMLADLAATHRHAPEANAFYQEYLKGSIRYALDERDLVGLDALFRYAFYYGLITDVPSIKYLPEGRPADIPEPPQA